MTAFRNRTFAQRFATMGDTAEGQFELLNPKAHRLGLNRPDLDMRKMHADLRYTPDYLTEIGAFEVMGVSSRQASGSLKLKLEKLDSLRAWDRLIPTHLWVWDSGRKRFWCHRIDVWGDACHEQGTLARFPDNNRPYWDLPIKLFPGEPVAAAQGISSAAA